MGLDIRLPIGLMFSVLGVVLVGTGLVEGTTMNTWTGSAMLLFATAMLTLARLARARAALAPASAPVEAEPQSGTRSRADELEVETTARLAS